MKPTLLFAMLSMVSAIPGASAATELEALRARCIEQERQIQILQDQIQKLQPTETASPKAPASPPVATAFYIVRPGDFLARIARKNHCSAAELAKINGLKPSSMIHPGQKLKLPTAANPGETPAKTTSANSLAGKTHKIQEGETYSSIARKYGVSAQSLIAANPNAKATALRPGQVIRLSADTPATLPHSEVRPLDSSAAPVPMPSANAAAPKPIPAPAPAAPKTTPAPAPEKPAMQVTETAANPPASTPIEEKPPSPPEKKIRSVTIDSEMTYAEFAAKHGTNITRLNDLNGLDLTNSTVLAKGSELYVPAQP